MKTLLMLFVGAVLLSSCMHKVEVATQENTPISVLEAKCDTVLIVGDFDTSEESVYITTLEKEPLYEIENASAYLFAIGVLCFLVGVFFAIVVCLHKN
jgi:PBP1b-binding outer membrane lipoprotein LpoB